MDILRCMDMFLITKILDLAYVQNYVRCLSQNKSDTKLFRVYLFTVFTFNREDTDKYTLTITCTVNRHFKIVDTLTTYLCIHVYVPVTYLSSLTSLAMDSRISIKTKFTKINTMVL